MIELDEFDEQMTVSTPAGIEVLYSWAPRRLYGLSSPTHPERVEVPSVTKILGVLDRSGPLIWWGQGVGVEGTLALFEKGALALPATKEEAVELLKEHRLTVNHQKDGAATRGLNIHKALEDWCEKRPIRDNWEEHEQGYIKGLISFLRAIEPAATEISSELMVGSLEHQYAGRFDLVLTLDKPVEVVTKIYPKRADKASLIPAGRYLMDLKTSKYVYPTHFLQLEGYEAAAVECGYPPTDHRAVIHVTADGRYELALNTDWCFADFLAVRKVYAVLNERP